MELLVLHRATRPVANNAMPQIWLVLGKLNTPGLQKLAESNVS